MENTIVLTNNKVYTALEVVNLFSEYISPKNVEILVDHLTYADLSEVVESFTEQDGVLFLNVGDGFFSVARREKS